jgi:hypothetical protein
MYLSFLRTLIPVICLLAQLGVMGVVTGTMQALPTSLDSEVQSTSTSAAPAASDLTTEIAASLIMSDARFRLGQECRKDLQTGPEVCAAPGTFTGELGVDTPYAVLHSQGLIEVVPFPGKSRVCRVPAHQVRLTEKGRQASQGWTIASESGESTRWTIPMVLSCAEKELLRVSELSKVPDRAWEERVAKFNWRWSYRMSGKDPNFRIRPDIFQDPALSSQFPPAPGKSDIFGASARFRLTNGRWVLGVIQGMYFSGL